MLLNFCQTLRSLIAVLRSKNPRLKDHTNFFGGRLTRSPTTTTAPTAAAQTSLLTHRSMTDPSRPIERLRRLPNSCYLPAYFRLGGVGDDVLGVPRPWATLRTKFALRITAYRNGCRLLLVDSVGLYRFPAQSFCPPYAFCTYQIFGFSEKSLDPVPPQTCPVQ